MYVLNHHAYCGMPGIPESFDDRAEARTAAADMLRRYRRRYSVIVLERGERWEVLEPEDSGMVPDDCGTIDLDHEQHECRECGSLCETPDDARACCAEAYC